MKSLPCTFLARAPDFQQQYCWIAMVKDQLMEEDENGRKMIICILCQNHSAFYPSCWDGVGPGEILGADW